MQIKKVAVLGAGAVGSYVIWGLSQAENLSLGVIAEGERAGRLKENGCLINGQVYRPEVWTPKEAHGADLLIVSLKYGALPGALDSIAQAVGEHTIVMSLMNGVDSEEIIAQKVNPDNILHALIKVASHKEENGYCFNPETTIGIIFGEIKPPFESERVQAVCTLFENAQIHFRVTDYIKEEMWNFLPENLTFVDRTSRAEILESEEAKIILTSSGMGSYGPAQEYIPEYLTRGNALIHFTGYTTEGTLGARLKEAEVGTPVQIGGTLVKKRAQVEYTTEYSAHAKADEMIDFPKKFKHLELVLVNHGEADTKQIFAERIINEVDTDRVGILGCGYFFRVNHDGLVKSMSTKFE